MKEEQENIYDGPTNPAISFLYANCHMIKTNIWASINKDLPFYFIYIKNIAKFLNLIKAITIYMHRSQY